MPSFKVSAGPVFSHGLGSGCRPKSARSKDGAAPRTPRALSPAPTPRVRFHAAFFSSLCSSPRRLTCRHAMPPYPRRWYLCCNAPVGTRSPEALAPQNARADKIDKRKQQQPLSARDRMTATSAATTPRSVSIASIATPRTPRAKTPRRDDVLHASPPRSRPLGWRQSVGGTPRESRMRCVDVPVSQVCNLHMPPPAPAAHTPNFFLQRSRSGSQ